MLAPTFTGLAPPGSSLTLLAPEVVSPTISTSSPSPAVTATSSTPAVAVAAPTATITPSASVSSVPSVAPTATNVATSPSGVSSWVVPESQKSVSAGHFANLDKSGTGAIGGAEAKEFFLRSQLPPPELAKIWALSDVNADGKLSLAEFQVAFFLTQQRSKQIDIPTNLPACLYESVGLVPPPTSIASSAQGSPIVSPTPSEAGSGHNSKTSSLMDVPAHNATDASHISPVASHSGSTASIGDLHAHSASPASHGTNVNIYGSAARLPEIREESPVPSPATRPPPSSSISVPPANNADFRLTMRMDPAQLKAAMEAEAAGNPTHMPTASGAPSSVPTHLQTAPASSDDWLITPDIKATYDAYFSKADELGSGYVSGPRARDLFTKASLPNNVLAEIWVLSDMNKDGQLDRAEFTLAMHLINLARRGIKPPPTLPMQMIESAGINPQFIADMKARAQREREEVEAKLRAELEAQAVQARQHQIYLEEQAELRRQEEDRRRQEEERQEVARMKQQIVTMLKEKEHFVRLLRQQQTYNIGVAQQILKVDTEADALRNDVSSMEMQVEKLKIKGASVKEHSETLMRHLAAAHEDKATLDSLLQQRRTQYMTEAAAVQSMESQLSENKNALARQTQDIAALRSSVASLQKANDERASRAFDPAVLQQKLQQEKLRQDFARATSQSSITAPNNASMNSSASALPRAESPAKRSALQASSGVATPGTTGSNSKTNSTGDFAAFPATVGTASGDDWAAFNESASTPAPTLVDDFNTQPGTKPTAKPKSFGFEDEQDAFGKPVPLAGATTPKFDSPSKTSPTTSSVVPHPHPDDDFAPSPAVTPGPTTAPSKEDFPTPDEDFFSGASSPSPDPVPVVTVAEHHSPQPARSNNPFPVEQELASPRNKTPTPTPSEPAAAVKPDEDFFSGPNPTSPPPTTASPPATAASPAPETPAQPQQTSTSTNPFPASDDTPADANGSPPISEATSKAFDDLFADVPATETSVTFGSADDLFGPSPTDSPAAASSELKGAFDEKLFDD